MRVSSSTTTVLFAYKWVRERARLFCKQTAVALTLGEGGATPCRSFPNSVFIQKPRRCPFREDFATAASLRSFIIYFFSGLRFQNLYLSFRFAEAGISQFLAYRGTWARGNICHFARSPTAGAKVQPRALSERARDVVAGLAPSGIFIRPLFRAGSPFYHISWRGAPARECPAPRLSLSFSLRDVTSPRPR